MLRVKDRKQMMEEETISLILRGCKLANCLESNIANLANQSNILLSSCDDIIKIFSLARERLHNHGLTPYPQAMQMIDADLQEWLRSSTSSQSQEIDINQTQSSTSFHIRGLQQLPESDSDQVAGVEGIDVHGKFVLSTDQKARKRKDNMEKQTVTVMMAAAPIMGNPELPPDDGFTWRKYGQKEILGSRFPRGYYRCTHRKLYQCPAKKQVQRSNDDPFTFQVTYRGEHTCHECSTASLVFPLLPFPASQQVTTQAQAQALTPHFLPPSLLPSGRGWLSVELSSGSSSSATRAGAGEATSTVPYDRETELMPVVDIADAMFNSATSSCYSMELLFPSTEPKWQPDDNKN